MKNIIITGVTGQDGSYMADYLLENFPDFNVIGIARRSSCPNYRNINHILQNPRFTLRLGDLSDYHSLEDLVKTIKPDYFINFGAQSFVGASWQIPEQTFDVVATGVLRCLEAIRKTHPTCRFYSAGSSEEMGDVLYSPQDKIHPMRPRSPYGAAKAAARHLVKVYRESYGLYAVHGILYNHEGPRRAEEFVTRKITKGVARICDAMKKGKPFQPIELGNLDSQRDWSHAKDFVRGIWMMLNQEVYNKNFYNHKDGVIGRSSTDGYKSNEEFLSRHLTEYILSSGETHSIREFVEKAFNIASPLPYRNSFYWTGKGQEEAYGFFARGLTDAEGNKDVFVPVVKINPKFYRPAEVDLLLGDSNPIRKELGWKPEYSFDDLVKDMIENDIKEAEQVH